MFLGLEDCTTDYTAHGQRADQSHARWTAGVVPPRLGGDDPGAEHPALARAVLSRGDDHFRSARDRRSSGHARRRPGCDVSASGRGAVADIFQGIKTAGMRCPL